MGRKTRAKKNTKKNKKGDGETSTSSKLKSIEMSQEPNQTADSQMEGGNPSKKAKTTDSSNSVVQVEAGPSEGQESKVKEVSMGDLPTEMLTKILKYVDTKSLFACRLINHKWNSISSKILTTRSDVLLKFVFKNNGTFTCYSHEPRMRTRRGKLSSLKDFVNCLKKSKNCPYARFSFVVRHTLIFDHEDWIEFICHFAPTKTSHNQTGNEKETRKIRGLYLGFFEEIEDALADKLRDLLVNKIPELEEFGLYCHAFFQRNSVKLFSPPQNTETESNAVSVPIQLPHLKLLCFHPLGILGIVADLLNAAVNLRSVRGIDRFFCSSPLSSTKSFELLHSLGKLGLLQNAGFGVYDHFLSPVKQQPSNFPLAFKLQDLYLEAYVSYMEPTSRTFAQNFISTVLESSKNSLRKLEMRPVGFLLEPQLPKLINLSTLTLHQLNNDFNELDIFQEPFFPPGTRSREIFPAVRDLNFDVVDCSIAFLQEDSIPCLPNVSTLCLTNIKLTEKYIITVALLCPNLKSLQIKRDEKNDREVKKLNFLQVGRSIWTHMEQLESLEVDLNLNEPENTSDALDSCFTGISLENCRTLSQMTDTNRKSEQEKSRFAVREHPSILNMKGLKKLTVNPYRGTKLLNKKGFFTRNVTWISQEFAFQFMPDLQLNGKY